MRTLVLGVFCVLCVSAARELGAQPATKVEPAKIECPHVLGKGVDTGAAFCDIWTGRTAEDGAIVRIPPHRGPATLTFTLHNRQTYSEALEKAGRAYTRATATIGVLTLEDEVLTRAVIQTEFRGAADLFDRVAADAAGTVKAIAPVGSETIVVEIPQNVDAVSLVGEKATIRRIDAEELVSAPGRAVAIVSDVKIAYRPAPARPVRRRR